MNTAMDNRHPAWWFSDEETFMRHMVMCEEDRLTDRLSPYKGPWRGGFRWFRSPNVVDLERYRRQRQMTCDAPRANR
jgi:hypothetical protein